MRPLLRAMDPALSLLGRLPESSARFNYLRQNARKFADSARLDSTFQQFFAGTQITSPQVRAQIYEPTFHAANDPADAFAQLEAEYFPDPALRRLDPLEQFMLADLTVHMPGSLLHRLDRTSMAHSLEAQVPFLSHKFVDWTLTMPREMKLHGRTVVVPRRAGNAQPRLPVAVQGMVPRRLRRLCATGLERERGGAGRVLAPRCGRGAACRVPLGNRKPWPGALRGGDVRDLVGADVLRPAFCDWGGVMLLESGGTDFEAATQELYCDASIGHPYYDLDEARLRFFGGTVSIWGGRAGQFDPIDFELGDFDYGEADAWATLGLKDPGFDPARLATRLWRFDEATERFAASRAKDPIAAADVRILLNTNVVRLQAAPEANGVTHAEICALGRGRCLTVRARRAGAQRRQTGGAFGQARRARQRPRRPRLAAERSRQAHRTGLRRGVRRRDEADGRAAIPQPAWSMPSAACTAMPTCGSRAARPSPPPAGPTPP